ncbi:MAG: hypothetical protein AAF617_15555 [Bacteroidota bacterium]
MKTYTMYLRILLLLLFFTITSCREKTKEATEKTATTELKFTNAVKGSKHINIPGTRLFIIPPDGFEISKGFVGLEKDATGIQVLELKEGNFDSNSRNFSKEKLEETGVEVLEYKELTVGEYPAKYAVMSGNNGLKAITLLFGNDTFSVSINAFMPLLTNKEEELRIINALQTLYYDIDFTVDPLANVQFTLDENASKFKFTKSGANVFIYTVDGIKKDSYADDSMILVTTLPIDESMTLRSTAERIINGLEAKGLLQVAEIKNKKSQVVDDIRMYQLDVHGTLKGEKVILFIKVAVNYDVVCTLQGIIKSNLEEDLAEAKKLANTLQLKN